MVHSIFGWSYPPGCSGPPDQDVPEHPLIDEVHDLLEEAGYQQSTIDRIASDMWELVGLANEECPVCLDLALEQERRGWEDQWYRVEGQVWKGLDKDE